MLKLNASQPGTHLTLSDGTPCDLSSVIGRDIPAGSVLAVVGRPAPHGDRITAGGDVSGRSLRPLLAVVSLLFLMYSLQLLVLVVPLALPTVYGSLIAEAPLPVPLRLAVALFTAALACAAYTRLRAYPLTSLFFPLTVGISALALLDPKSPTSFLLAFPVVFWVALVASVILWSFGRNEADAASAAVFATLAAVSTAIVATSIAYTIWAPIVLALIVATLPLQPSAALRIPQSQLIDLPLVLTSAPRVRFFKTTAPSRITSRRVEYSLTTADARALVLMTASMFLVIGCIPALSGIVDFHSWSGIAGAGAMLCAAGGLFLVPRTWRAPLLRVFPRIVALLIVVMFFASPPVQEEVGIGLAPVLSFALATVVIGGHILHIRIGQSALLGRVGDIFQSIALTCVIPTAVASTELFHLVRQVAS